MDTTASGKSTRDSLARTRGPRIPKQRTEPVDLKSAQEAWEVVQRVQAGEVKAFEIIFAKYKSHVFRFINFRVGNRDLAKDLTSDTFLHALEKIDSFKWEGRSLEAWLITIARNLVTDHYKSSRYRNEITTAGVGTLDQEDHEPEAHPDAMVIDHIRNVALLSAVKQLGPDQQECIILRFLKGFSVAETARAMRRSEGAVKQLQHRALKSLACLLPEDLHTNT